jgi:hypothetical protein
MCFSRLYVGEVCDATVRNKGWCAPLRMMASAMHSGTVTIFYNLPIAHNAAQLIFVIQQALRWREPDDTCGDSDEPLWSWRATIRKRTHEPCGLVKSPDQVV